MKITIDLNIKDYPLLKQISKDKQKEFVEEVFNFGYNVKFPNIDKKDLVDESYNTDKIIDCINSLPFNDNLLTINSVMGKLLNIQSSSNKKGEVSEKMIEEYFINNYKNLSYENTREIPHSGDGMLHLNNKKILVEVKNYSLTVPIEEVNKFDYDMSYTKSELGLFISIGSNIRNRSNFDYRCINKDKKKYHQIFISNVGNNFEKIDLGILFLQEISKVNNELKLETDFIELEKIISETIDLRDKFKLMESSIHKSLDVFYSSLRDSLFNVENKVKSILSNIKNDQNVYVDRNVYDDIIIQYENEKYWGINILTKLFDIFIKNNVLLDENEGNYIIKQKSDKIGELKIIKSKITVEIDQHEFKLQNKNTNKETKKVLNRIEEILI